MRKVILAGLLALGLASAAEAGWKSQSTASIANGATYTGAGWFVGDASTLTVCCQFTTAATAGTVTMNVDVSMDRGTTWTLGYTADPVTVAGAGNYVITKPLTRIGIPGGGQAVPFCPAPYVRLRVTNNVTTATTTITAVTVGVIYN